jgi:hypothetical protein
LGFKILYAQIKKRPQNDFWGLFLRCARKGHSHSEAILLEFDTSFPEAVVGMPVPKLKKCVANNTSELGFNG